MLVTGSWLAAAAGAGFALATLGGYLLSVWIGLFGFKEVRTTAGIVAGVIEVAAFAVLAVLARPGGRATRRPGRRRAAGPPAGGIAGSLGVAGVSVVALVVLGVSVAGPAARPRPAAGGSLKTVQIGGVTVLTNANGFTLYWFAPDTAAKSVCNGSCAAYWPPVKGPATAGPGRHRQARHDQAVGRLGPGHLRRSPPVHLRRRHRPRPGPRQQPQPERRAVARGNPVRLAQVGTTGCRTRSGLPEAGDGSTDTARAPRGLSPTQPS